MNVYRDDDSGSLSSKNWAPIGGQTLPATVGGPTGCGRVPSSKSFTDRSLSATVEAGLPSIQQLCKLRKRLRKIKAATGEELGSRNKAAAVQGGSCVERKKQAAEIEVAEAVKTKPATEAEKRSY
ncbi:hypothetical protein M9H77_06793 [Catharanthus roseus]|uniref:Uncharacterized protein n=1 Tax=Catharanthus roseus TaxID=4058 RepID=A0ACC0BTB9_CATRO|nr:hypothetical protein M9H77_06793 [Catharanthus roseus]